MKIQIIGLGNLGLFLAHHFIESGLHVSGWDINPDKKSVLKQLGGSWNRDDKTDAIILVLFPEQITKELLKDLSPTALLVNVSSVQQPGLKALSNAGVEETRVFSFHPLFGPVGVTKSGWVGKQIVVTTEPENDPRTSTILETFTHKGVTIDRMTPKEHDNKMLPHALAFLIAELVKVGAEGVDPRFLTGSGRQMLGLLDFTEAGSIELRNLILSNPGLKGAVPKLKKVLKKLSNQHGW